MSRRAEITITVKIPFDVHPENYPDGLTWNERLAEDVKNVDEDPFALLESADAEWGFSGRSIDAAQQEQTNDR